MDANLENRVQRSKNGRTICLLAFWFKPRLLKELCLKPHKLHKPKIHLASLIRVSNAALKKRSYSLHNEKLLSLISMISMEDKSIDPKQFKEYINIDLPQGHIAKYKEKLFD